MKSIALCTACLVLSMSAHASAPDPANGERLFKQSRCLSCHTTEVFTSPTRKVKSYAALESQVRRCDANLSTNWFDDQILDVVSYLNQMYYKFPTTTAAPVKP
ncbi:MAG TPA: hypothetical protein PLM98_02220 [Thiolinea sp.]|nr:hypothetical protein [Thiolinea sp.]